MSDTIFALSSGALPAAIAIVRVSGPQAEVAARALAATLPEPRQAALRRLRDREGQVIDDALLLRFPAPHTATGEPLVEFHVHGGRAVVARLLAELATMPGLREAEPGEFTRRALLNGRLDLTQAEGLGELLAAETEWQRRAAVGHAGGGLRRQIEHWRDRLIVLAAQAEAAIDYVDEEETSLDLTQLCQDAARLRDEWEVWLARPHSELLSEGLRIVLAGPPNSGKSSLFNALVGAEKAIVTPMAGTTRDLIEARLDLHGIPATLIDTAGLRSSADVVEQIGIARAEEAGREADILLWLGDPELVPYHEGRILVHARADQRGPAPTGSIAVSAVTGAGLEHLRQRLVALSSSMLPPPDNLALNRRQATALESAVSALRGLPLDLVIMADGLRLALDEIDRLSGREGVEDVLDTLFGRFCLGK